MSVKSVSANIVYSKTLDLTTRLIYFFTSWSACIRYFCMNLDFIIMTLTVQDELKDVKSRIKNIVPNTEIVACHQANVQIKIV